MRATGIFRDKDYIVVQALIGFTAVLASTVLFATVALLIDLWTGKAQLALALAFAIGFVVSITIHLHFYRRDYALVKVDKASEHLQQVVANTHSLHEPAMVGIDTRERHDRYGQMEELQEAILRLQQALADASPGSPEQAMILYKLGKSLRERYERTGQMEDLQMAIEQFRQAHQIAQKVAGWKEEDSIARITREANFYWGVKKQAIEYYKREVEVARETGDLSRVLLGLYRDGNAYLSTGQAERAIEYFELEVEVAREIGDRNYERYSLNNLGEANYVLGQAERAIEYFKQAVKIARELGELGMLSVYMNSLANAYILSGQVERAIDYYKRAIEYFELEVENGRKFAVMSGYRRLNEISLYLKYLSNAYMISGQAERAIEYFELAVEVTRETGDRQGESHNLYRLGIAYILLGQAEQANLYFKRAQQHLA